MKHRTTAQLLATSAAVTLCTSLGAGAFESTDGLAARSDKASVKSSSNGVMRHEVGYVDHDKVAPGVDAARRVQQQPMPISSFPNAQTLDFDVSGIESFAAFGSPLNEVFNIDIGANSHVIGIGWDVTIEAFTPSWLSEMRVDLTDAGISAGVSLQVGVGDGAPGVGAYDSGGILTLADFGLDFSVDADGILRLEFWESFTDFATDPDGIWLSGTITVQYVTAGADCPADINDDGVVDVSDLLALLGAWGPNPGHPADVNGDGVVDVSDLLALLGAWGACPPGGVDPVGACCMPGFSCLEKVSETDCDAAGGSYAGDFTSCASCPDPPSGELCDSAYPLSPGQTISADSTGNASADASACGGVTPNQPAVWFLVEGSGNMMTVSVDTTVSGPGSSAAIYCGSCDSPLCVAGGTQNSNGPNPFDAEVSWCAASGKNYFIAVWRTGGGGTFDVSLAEFGSCTPTVSCGPENDTCATAQDITANIDGAPVQGDNVGASSTGLPSGSPSCHWAGNPANTNNVVWFKFTAPASSVTVTSCNSQGTLVDTVMAMYEGGCGNLSEIACGEDECGGPTWFSTMIATGLSVGDEYYVMVANPGFGNPGSFTFVITSGAPSGACCDGLDCTDGVEQGNCDGPFYLGQTCAEIGGCPDCPDDADDSCTAQFIYDDCVTDNALGLNGGGVIGWAQRFDAGAGATINNIATAYGQLGANAGVQQCDPVGWAIMTDSGAGPGTVIAQGVDEIALDAIASDLSQIIPTGGVAVNGTFYVVVWVEHPAGSFPLPMDESAPGAFASDVWAIYTVGGTFGAFNPAAPEAMINMAGSGFPSVHFLRANQ